MKARLVPIYFPVGKDSGFDVQLDNLKRLLSEQVEFLEPTALGAALAEDDAARENLLSPEDLHTPALAVGVPAVLR